WDAGAFAETYRVYLSDDLGTKMNFQAIPIPSATTSTNPSELVAGRSYCFKVTAENRSGESGPSNMVCPTLYGFPQPLQTSSVILQPQVSGTGRLLNLGTVAPIAGGVVNFFDLRASDNDPRVAGVIPSPPATSERVSGCR